MPPKRVWAPRVRKNKVYHAQYVVECRKLVVALNYADTDEQTLEKRVWVCVPILGYAYPFWVYLGYAYPILRYAYPT